MSEQTFKHDATVEEQMSAMREALLSLATADGINASGRDELYGCTFGRDTAITVLLILAADRQRPDGELLALCRRALLTLCSLAGTKQNIETGEEPGKFIHEFRRERYEHLTSGNNWQLAEDGTLRNFDSIDATPLALIAIYRYWEQTGDEEFLAATRPAVEAGLRWLSEYADKNDDGFIDYVFDTSRTHGGLRVQSWTDSNESMGRADGSFPSYPIAPVEAQGYAWLAWKLWADRYEGLDLAKATEYRMKAALLKQNFNQNFITEKDGVHFAAQAIDGDGNVIATATINPALALWACYARGDGPPAGGETIFDAEIVPDIVKRLFEHDMFEPEAGIRTMSTQSPTFNPRSDSYHNGSFWPMANCLAFLGLHRLGYTSEARVLADASLAALKHYETPIELYLKNPGEDYLDYARACKVQAWSAAAFLAMLAYGPLLPQPSPVAPLEPETA